MLDQRKIAMTQRRSDLVRMSDIERHRVVAEFPLLVASMANDLKGMIEWRLWRQELDGDAKAELDEGIELASGKIQSAFAEQFGIDLLPPTR